VLSHEHYSTVGHLVPAMAEKAGIKAQLEANVVSRTRGGGAAANAVMVGTADASIVWQAVAHLRRDKLDAVPIEPEYQLKKGVDAVSSATFGIIEQGRVRVTIAVVKYSKQPRQANDFAEFTASKEAAAIWKKQGFALPEGGAVKEVAQKERLFIHCAAGMRKPVEVLAAEFRKKWGARVELSYDGSNRLLGQIKLTRKGDVYIAGDADYIDMAEKAGLVGSRKTICFFMPVIMVPKGNPGHILGLKDLLKAGLKIGVGDEKAAAVGRLTPEILKLNNIDIARWKKNVVLSTPTVNELGLAVKLGTVDAALVWRSVAKHYPDVSDIVTLDPEKNIIPAVEGAVLDYSDNPAAAAAFLDYLTSDRGRAVLTENGYLVERPK
jgi:molybdate transport system substrate-binding protein